MENSGTKGNLPRSNRQVANAREEKNHEKEDNCHRFGPHAGCRLSAHDGAGRHRGQGKDRKRRRHLESTLLPQHQQ